MYQNGRLKNSTAELPPEVQTLCIVFLGPMGGQLASIFKVQNQFFHSTLLSSSWLIFTIYVPGGFEGYNWLNSRGGAVGIWELIARGPGRFTLPLLSISLAQGYFYCYLPEELHLCQWSSSKDKHHINIFILYILPSELDILLVPRVKIEKVIYLPRSRAITSEIPSASPRELTSVIALETFNALRFT
jgi:hypothetical protein